MTGRLVTAGLAPSPALAPSPSLAPATAIYSGGQISPHQIALACGTGGAYVDVTSYVEFGEGVTYNYGRPDQFSDPAPGTFGFTLNNADGRFTPGNPASPLATTVTEGMGVSWLLGTRLVHGTVLAVEIPADEATWYQIRFTCDDMLGTAGRHQLTSIADGLTALYNPVLWWKLDEASDATAGVEQSGALLGAFAGSSSSKSSSTVVATFGQPQHPALPGTAVTITAGPNESNRFTTQHGNTQLRTAFPYPIPTDTTQTYYYGSWSFWVYPGSTINFNVIPYWAVGAGYSDSMQVIITPSTIAVKGGTNAAVTHTYTAAEQTAPHYVSLYSQLVWQTVGSYWAHSLILTLDGTQVASTFMQSAVLGYVVPAAMLAAGTAFQPLEVGFNTSAGAAQTVSGTVQRVSHTLNSATTLEQNALLNVEDERRAVLDTLATDISSAAYNGRASLSRALIGYPSVDGRSVLDVYNDIVRTEQGHLFCTTTGSLLNPVETIQVRDRDRPTTVKAAFHVTNEAQGIPAFLRDITNVAASVQVTGPDTNVTVTDPTVKGRYVTSGLSETVLLESPTELRMWGQDRLNRGKNTGIRIDTVTVDAVTTPTDRSAALLGLVPGDRLQVTGLPTGVLGFSTWDGWVIGCTENHGQGIDSFTFRLQPCTVSPAIYNTDRYANDGAVTLASNITATQTSITVASAVGAVMSTDVPYDITIGTSLERCTVTAVSGNTLTVVRGVGTVTARTHTTTSPLELASVATYAY